MLDKFLALIKETVSGAVSGNSNIPEEKKDQAIETTVQSFTDGLKQHMTLDNISKLTGLFKKDTEVASNPLTGSIQSSVTNALVNQVNLPQGIASAFSSSVVPMIISAISGKLNDPNGKGFELKELIHNIWGKEDEEGENNEEEKTSLLDRITKFFGHKS